jgi:hypothetical protein
MMDAQAMGERGGVDDIRVALPPPFKRRAMLGSFPSLSIGSMTSNVAPSRPIIRV